MDKRLFALFPAEISSPNQMGILLPSLSEINKKANKTRK